MLVGNSNMLSQMLLTLLRAAACLLNAAAAVDNFVAAWAFFAMLTAVHVWANIRAMRCLVLSSLNETRLKLLLQHYQEKVTVQHISSAKHKFSDLHAGEMLQFCLPCHEQTCTDKFAITSFVAAE